MNPVRLAHPSDGLPGHAALPRLRPDHQAKLDPAGSWIVHPID